MVSEKEKVIIDAAIKLFAERGFAATSIQEIALKSGISKGAFYLHFKSKEALLLEILQNYFETMKKNVFNSDYKGVSAKDRFLKQLAEFLKILIEHKEFFIMISRGQTVPLNNSAKELIFNMHKATYDFYLLSLKDIYGENVLPYVWDLSVMLDGFFQGYIRVLLFDQECLDLEKAANFIYRRVDTLYKGFISSGDEPLLTEARMGKVFNRTKAFMVKQSTEVSHVLDEMKQKVKDLGKGEDLSVSLEVLELESKRLIPRPAVIQGMLSNFKGIPGFEIFIEKISSIYK